MKGEGYGWRDGSRVWGEVGEKVVGKGSKGLCREGRFRERGGYD